MTSPTDDPFKDIVDSFRCVSLILSPPHLSLNWLSLSCLSMSPMVKSLPYSALVEQCNIFLHNMQPHRFPTEGAKISFIISLLTGKALQWDGMICQQSSPSVNCWRALLLTLKRYSKKPLGDLSVSDQRYHLCQGKMSINDYDLKFCTLAAASGWNENALQTSFHQGLSP